MAQISPEKQLYELLQQSTKTMQEILKYADANMGEIASQLNAKFTQELAQMQELAEATQVEPLMHDFYYYVELLVEEVINARKMQVLREPIYNSTFGEQLETLMSMLREMVSRNADAKAALTQQPQRYVLKPMPVLDQATLEALVKKYQAAEEQVELANQENMKLARRLQLRIKQKKGLDQAPPADPYESTLRAFVLGAAATLIAEELELARSHVYISQGRN